MKDTPQACLAYTIFYKGEANPVDIVPNSPESLLIRNGLSYASLLEDEYAEQLVDALRDTEINVDSPEAEVKVYAE